MARIAIAGVALVGLLAAAVYFLSQDPKVRSLFESAPARENPLEFLENLPEPKVPPPVVERKKPQKPAPPEVDPEPSNEPEVVQNMVPNRDVARVLMQILAAKKLADGISISVSDEAVVIHGEVSSSAKLDEIVAVVEKGRESRKIDTTHLSVASNQEPGQQD
jgi:hypothetical protein